MSISYIPKALSTSSYINSYVLISGYARIQAC